MKSVKLQLLILTLALVTLFGFFLLGERPTTSAVGQPSIAVDQAARSDLSKSSSELIQFWQERAENNVGDYISQTYLGEAYLRKARENGDIAFYNLADQALEGALDINPRYSLALAYLASVRIAQHDFVDALALATRVYEADPEALHALATVGDANLELGNYEAAQAAYEMLLAQNESSAVLARLARLRWIMGDPEAAVALLETAVSEIVSGNVQGEGGAWYHIQLGELYLKIGQLDKAEAQFEQALARFDGYLLAWVGQAKVAAAAGRTDEAIALYERVVTRLPQPDYLASLADLYEATGREDEAAQQMATIAAIAQLQESQGVIYDRQLIYIYADRGVALDLALAMAARELEMRQDVYGYDAYAWALYKNGRYAEAAAAMDIALQFDTPEPLFQEHAAQINAALTSQQ